MHPRTGKAGEARERLTAPAASPCGIYCPIFLRGESVWVYPSGISNWDAGVERFSIFVTTVVTPIISVCRGNPSIFLNASAIPFPPTFILDNKAAQELMDDLWSCGLRPTEGTGSAGAMAAVQEHLADLRRLVFDHDYHVDKKPPMMEIKY